MSIRTYTQEDPIGLAGGLNLYGFANGDPVNFSDPFGLCPECEQGESEKPGFRAVIDRKVSKALDAASEAVATGLEKVNNFIAGVPILGGLVASASGVGADGTALSGGDRATALAGAGADAAAGGVLGAVGRPFVGNAISGFTKHGIDQVINRGVSPAALLDAARHGSTRGPLVDHLGRESLRVRGRAAEFAINLLGRVTTVWRR